MSKVLAVVLCPAWMLPYAGDGRVVVFVLWLLVVLYVLMDACRAVGNEY
jgi:hypothetical protein